MVRGRRCSEVFASSFCLVNKQLQIGFELILYLGGGSALMLTLK